MPCSRREAIAALSALMATPLWPTHVVAVSAADPLLGTTLEFQAGRQRGDFTAREMVERALERCRTHGMGWRAIDQLSATALTDAAASDARLRARRLRGPLDGVPVFAKSIYDVQGMPTTASSAEWVELFPRAVPHDAIEVARLRAAGAVIMGKTAADDFAYRGNGTSSLTGQVLNPYDASQTRTPGGSSAGAAVVVAAGMAFSALGTDDGGSNRIPAQFSGVVGMKPTFGLVPRTGVLPTWPYLDTHGPLARSVIDAACMLWALAGPDPSDPLSHETGTASVRGLFAAATPAAAMPAAAMPAAAMPAAAVSGRAPAFTAEALRGKRLGVVDAHAPREQMSAASVAQFDRALADCRAAGAVVDTFDAPVTRINVRELFALEATKRRDVRPDANSAAATANALYRYFLRQGVHATQAVQRGHRAYRAFYDVLPEDWTAMEALLTQPYERDPAGVSFARSREQVVARLRAAMQAQRVDALVYPTMPFPAPAARDAWPDVRTPLGFGNWMGLPEVSVPAGYGTDGVPVGNLSLVGLPGDDAHLLAMAYAYEQHSRRFTPPPGVGSP